tara:strand:+ start:1133 stop:1255 length:123 start_codon:yes stop_codon:yes gene_type:complete
MAVILVMDLLVAVAVELQLLVEDHLRERQVVLVVLGQYIQ